MNAAAASTVTIFAFCSGAYTIYSARNKRNKSDKIFSIFCGCLLLTISAYVAYNQLLNKNLQDAKCKLSLRDDELLICTCSQALKNGVTLLNGTKVSLDINNIGMNLGAGQISGEPACIAIDNITGYLEELELIGKIAKEYFYNGCAYKIIFDQYFPLKPFRC